MGVATRIRGRVVGGFVIATPDGMVELCGGEPGGTTNNRMELTAAIKGLEHFSPGAAIEMRCDSQYVVKSATEWMRGVEGQRLAYDDR